MPPIDDDDLLPDERAFISGNKDAAAPAATTEPPAKAEAGTDGTPAAGAEEATTEGEQAAKTDAGTNAGGDTPPAGGSEALDPDALAAVATPPEAQPFVPKLEAPPTDDLKAKLEEQRKQFLAKRREFNEGKLTDEEFERLEAAYETERQQLMIDLAAAEAIKRSGEQIQQQAAKEREGQQMAVLRAIAVQAKKDGVDYAADPALGVQFDHAMAFVAADPQWANRSFAEIALEANRLVMQRLGKTPAAPAAPAASAANAAAAAQGTQPQRDVPKTLGGLPAAGAPPVQNDLMTRIQATADPDELETMLERLPVSQREALMRATVRA